MTPTRSRRGRDAQAGPGRAWPGQGRRRRAGPRGWRCSAAWWPRLSSGSRRAGPRAATAAWRRSTAAPSAWKSTIGPWPSAAADTRECAGLREAAGSGAAAGSALQPPRRARTRGARVSPRRAVSALWARPSPSAHPPARPSAHPGLSIRSPRRQTGPTCNPARSLTGSARGR